MLRDPGRVGEGGFSLEKNLNKNSPAAADTGSGVITVTTRSFHSRLFCSIFICTFIGTTFFKAQASLSAL